MNVIQKAVVLNLSDGITTPMSFLLPMVLFGGHFDAKAMILGSIGAAVSMAFAFKSAESTEGTWTEWLVAFVSSVLGGLLPTLCFVFFPRTLAMALSLIIIIIGILVVAHEKTNNTYTIKQSLLDTSKSIIPALLIVGGLSIL